MNCAILCPGPSLRSHLDKDFSGYQRLVAVTCAVLADLPFSVFSFQEGPSKPRYRTRYFDRLMELQPTIWTVKGSREEWWKYFPEIPRRLIDDETSVADSITRLGYHPHAWLATDPTKPPLKPDSRCGCADRGRFAGPPHRHIRPTAGSSMFYALARCIAEGFTEIDIYGSDMEGKHNHHPYNKTKFAWKGAQKWWDRRWEHERAAIKDIIAEAAENGIKVTRVPGVSVRST